MQEFINNLKYEIINCMTDDDKDFIDLEDRYYVEFGYDATNITDCSRLSPQ